MAHTKTTTMGVKVDMETRERLKALGEIQDRSPHYLMKEAIRKYLDNEERYEHEKAEDMARIEEYKTTGRHVTHEAMIDYLDSWGTENKKSCPKPEE